MSRLTWVMMWVLVAASLAGLVCFVAVPKHTPASLLALARAEVPRGTPEAEAEEWLSRRSVSWWTSMIGKKSHSLEGLFRVYRLGWPEKLIRLQITLSGDGKVTGVEVRHLDE